MKLRIATPMRGRHRGGDTVYHLRVEEVTLARFLIGRLYHWYDMRIPARVPGYKALTGLLSRRFGAEVRLWADDPPARLRDRLYQWSISQDLRCHTVNYTWRKTLAVVPLDEETYHAVVNRTDDQV